MSYNTCSTSRRGSTGWGQPQRHHSHYPAPGVHPPTSTHISSRRDSRQDYGRSQRPGSQLRTQGHVSRNTIGTSPGGSTDRGQQQRHHSHYPTPDVHPPTSTHHSSGHYSYQDYDRSQEHGSQLQTQRHIFRSAQASKQMVYDVYGNTLTMLEELEQREQKKGGGKTLARSDIYLPSQRAYDTDTIKTKLDTQLLLLQSQLQSCDRQILDEVREDLKKKTLDWASHRQANNAKRGKTDEYAGKLFEVLAKGKTDHPADFYKTPSITEEGMHRAMGAYMHGKEMCSRLDRDFKSNPNKTAVAPRVRGGVGINMGVDRMAEERPDMTTEINRFRKADLK